MSDVNRQPEWYIFSKTPFLVKKFVEKYENEIPFATLEHYKKKYQSYSFFNRLVSLYSYGLLAYYLLMRRRVWFRLTINWGRSLLFNGCLLYFGSILPYSMIVKEAE